MSELQPQPIETLADESAWLLPALRGGSDPGLLALLVELSTRFINSPTREIDRHISDALQRVGQYLGVDRSFMYLLDSDHTTAKLIYEWQRDSSLSFADKTPRIPVAISQWGYDRLSAGKTIAVAQLSDLPTESGSLRELFVQLGLTRFIYVPMRTGDHFLGYIGLACLGTVGPWLNHTQHLLNVLASIFVNLLNRAHTESARAKSEQLYRQLIEDQDEYIMRWRPDGVATLINKAVCRFAGRTREQLLSEPLWSLIDAADLAKFKRKLRRLTPANPVSKDRRRMLRGDGELRWVEWSDRAIFAPNGTVVEYQSVGRDITDERVNNERIEYLRKLEALLVDISSNFIKSPLTAAETGLMEGLKQVAEFTRFDRAFLFLIDDSRQRAIAHSVWSAPQMDEFPPGLTDIDVNEFPWASSQLRRGEVLWVPRIDDLPPEADKAYQDFHAFGVKSFINIPVVDDGKLKGFFGLSTKHEYRQLSADSIALLRLLGEIFVHTIEHRTAEMELAASEERLGQVVDVIAACYFDWDLLTGLVYVNDAWLRTYGSPDESHFRRRSDWEGSIHPDDLAAVREVLNDHLNGGTEQYTSEYRMQDSAGKYHWLHSIGKVIERDDAGRPLRMVGVNRDITSEVEDAERIQKLQEQLKHLARLATMGEVVAGVAHEINQPLHAAATFAAASRRAISSGDEDACVRAKAMLVQVDEQIHRAAEIIRRMRDFCRPRKANLQKFDLNGVIREAAELQSVTMKRPGVRIAFDFDEALPKILGDPIQIQQVVVNLLRNALQSVEGIADEMPRVTLRTRELEDSVELAVIDNGTGPPANIDHYTLFDSFVTTKEDGMGMGLAICKSIVEAHHGSIRADKNDEGGMTFTIELPHESVPM